MKSHENKKAIICFFTILFDILYTGSNDKCRHLQYAQ